MATPPDVTESALPALRDDDSETFQVRDSLDSFDPADVGLPEEDQPAVKQKQALPLRAARKVKRRITRLTTAKVTVEMPSWDTIEVKWKLPPRSRRYRLGVPERSCRLTALQVEVTVPDLPALIRLANSGVLTGHTRSLTVSITDYPAWLRGGRRAMRSLWASTTQSWQASENGASATLSWANKRPLDRAMSEILALHSRDHAWPQLGGVVFGEDRHSFARGAMTWPRSYLIERSPYVSEVPLGPYTIPPAAQELPDDVGWPLVTSVATSYGREMVGLPTRYTAHLIRQRGSGGGAERSVSELGLVVRDTHGKDVLVFDQRRSPEPGLGTRADGSLASPGWDKFSTISLPEGLAKVLGDSPYLTLVAKGLAASGAILCSREPVLVEALGRLGLYAEEEADSPPNSLAQATGQQILSGYTRSVASSRAATIASDPMLRMSPLAGRNLVSLPSISITMSSKRPDDIEDCLSYLAAQTYPQYEIVLGTHGYLLDEQITQRWHQILAERGVGLRVIPLPEQQTFGQALAQLATLADGELLTKVDDDDHYGPNHLLDLLLALRTSGADIVAKSSRFTYFADEDFTIDRTWGAKELYDGTPAGGTMLITRGALAEIGGWSTSVRHVDTDLISRAKGFGVPRYRTHSLGYVYVRKSQGHTWAADHDKLLSQGEHRYEGLPVELLG